MFFNFPFALVDEFIFSRGSKRIPEPNLVMDDEEQVEAFSEAGSGESAIVIPHFFSLFAGGVLIKPGDVVVDFGCGSGELLFQYAAAVPEADFIGIEYSSKMIAKAEEVRKKNHLNNVSFIEGDARNVSQLLDNAVDVVMSSFTLHHMEGLKDVEKVFQEMSRVLKENGNLFIFDFSRLRSERLMDYLADSVAKYEPKVFNRDFRNSLSAAFTADEIEDKFRLIFQDRFSFSLFSPFPLYFWIRSKEPYRVKKDSILERILTEKLSSFKPFQKRLFRKTLSGFGLQKELKEYL